LVTVSIDNVTADVEQPLPFNWIEAGRLRVNLAELAKIVGVTRQSTHGWAKRGLIRVGADGKVDPVEAIKAFVRNADPARVRTRFLRTAVLDHAQLRARVEQLEAERDNFRTQLAAHRAEAERTAASAAFAAEDEFAAKIGGFCALLQNEFPALVDAHRGRRLDDALDDLVGRAFYPDAIGVAAEDQPPGAQEDA